MLAVQKLCADFFFHELLNVSSYIFNCLASTAYMQSWIQGGNQQITSNIFLLPISQLYCSPTANLQPIDRHLSRQNYWCRLLLWVQLYCVELTLFSRNSRFVYSPVTRLTLLWAICKAPITVDLGDLDISNYRKELKAQRNMWFSRM